jgi:hypothetical protein
MRGRMALLGLIGSLVLGAHPAPAATPTQLKTDARHVGLWVQDEVRGSGYQFEGNLVAAFLTSGGQPVVGRAVTFRTSAGLLICEASTGEGGRASCSQDSVIAAMPFQDFVASFDGDDEFGASSAAGNLGHARVSLGEDELCNIYGDGYLLHCGH